LTFFPGLVHSEEDLNSYDVPEILNGQDSSATVPLPPGINNSEDKALTQPLAEIGKFLSNPGMENVIRTNVVSTLASPSEMGPPPFYPCPAYRGFYPGYVFQYGPFGVGYYLDTVRKSSVDNSRSPAPNSHVVDKQLIENSSSIADVSVAPVSTNPLDADLKAGGTIHKEASKAETLQDGRPQHTEEENDLPPRPPGPPPPEAFRNARVPVS